MIYTVYASKDDMTFIMEEVDGVLSVKGFYFGEPDKNATKAFYNSLDAVIEEED